MKLDTQNTAPAMCRHMIKHHTLWRATPKASRRMQCCHAIRTLLLKRVHANSVSPFTDASTSREHLCFQRARLPDTPLGDSLDRYRHKLHESPGIHLARTPSTIGVGQLNEIHTMHSSGTHTICTSLEGAKALASDAGLPQDTGTTTIHKSRMAPKWCQGVLFQESAERSQG